MKICSQCHLPKTKFQRDSSKKDGFRNECKECSHKKGKEKYIKHINSIKAKYKVKYDKNHLAIKQKTKEYYQTGGGKERERERARGRSLELHKLLGGQCIRCGRKDYLSIDHINDDGHLDRAKGSKDAMVRKLLNNQNRHEIVQLLCYNCNQKKNIEFINHKLTTKKKTDIKKFCPTCKINKDTSNFTGDIRNVDKLYYECLWCVKARRIKLKTETFAIYESKCKLCSEMDIDVLSIDHIDPIGKKREAYGNRLYEKILSGKLDKNKFQLLCFNCNQKKAGH